MAGSGVVSAKATPPLSGTGTASAQPAFAVALYPHPPAGAVRLARAAAPAAQSQVQVFDLTGRLLQTRRFSGSSYALETSGWAAGTYFMRVQSGTAVAMQRLVVER